MLRLQPGPPQPASRSRSVRPQPDSPRLCQKVPPSCATPYAVYRAPPLTRPPLPAVNPSGPPSTCPPSPVVKFSKLRFAGAQTASRFNPPSTSPQFAQIFGNAEGRGNFNTTGRTPHPGSHFKGSFKSGGDNSSFTRTDRQSHGHRGGGFSGHRGRGGGGRGTPLEWSPARQQRRRFR